MVYGLLCAFAAAPLAACDPRFVHKSDLRPAEIQRLAGTWEGEARLSYYTAEECPTKIYQWTMKVTNGNVAVEIIDPKKPKVAPARFTSFVDYDGSVHGDTTVFGRDTVILGTFNRSGFEGDTKSRYCNYSVRLRQRPGS